MYLIYAWNREVQIGSRQSYQVRVYERVPMRVQSLVEFEFLACWHYVCPYPNTALPYQVEFGANKFFEKHNTLKMINTKGLDNLTCAACTPKVSNTTFATRDNMGFDFVISLMISA